MRLSQRDFSAEELRWLKENTKRQSRQFSARMLAVADDKTYLARLRAGRWMRIILYLAQCNYKAAKSQQRP